MTMEKIPEDVIEKIRKNECEGDCEKHVGTVKAVYVHDSPFSMWFAYCDTAIKKDKKSFRVTVLEFDEWLDKQEKE